MITARFHSKQIPQSIFPNGRASNSHTRIVYAWHKMADVSNENPLPLLDRGLNVEKILPNAVRAQNQKAGNSALYRCRIDWLEAIK